MKKWILYFTLFHAVNLTAQNLVLNPSFEDTTWLCPTGWNELFLCKYWSNASEGGGTPDYFNACNTNGFVDVPQHYYGFQYAKSGNAYAGVISYDDSPIAYNERENIQGKLKNPLDSGKIYCSGFYVSLRNSSFFAIDAMGMYFRPDSFYTPVFPPPPPLIYDPNNYIDNPSGNFLSDTAGWILIANSFVAQGNERFLIIGNLKDYSDLNNISIQTDTLSNRAYYYIDDVFLYEVKPLFIHESDTTVCSNNPVSLTFHADNAVFYTWYVAGDSSNVLSTDDSLTITAPAQTTQYVVKGEACNYISYDTITVTITDCPPPQEIIPNVITPNGDGLNDVFYIQNLQQGSALTIYNRWGTLIFDIGDYQNDWPGTEQAATLSEGVYFFIFHNPQGVQTSGFMHVFR